MHILSFNFSNLKRTLSLSALVNKHENQERDALEREMRIQVLVIFYCV